MAPPKKLRPTPLDDPPTASSSSEEDDPQPPPKKPQDEVVDEEEEDSSEEGEEEDDQNEDEEEEEGSSSEEEEQVQPTPPPSQPASKNPKPESASESASESESESGSGSDSEQEPTPPNAKVKPLASKPMKPQPQSQSTPVPPRSGTKRPNENDSKRAKKKTSTAGAGSENEADGDGDVKMTGEDSKKIYQRVFTEEDEIAILKGLAEFISKTGKDPMKDPVTFHSFVRKSIHGDVSNEQLKRKVRGLKMKFKSGASFTREHDKKAFELSKKVWSDNGVVEGVIESEENEKVSEKTPKSSKKEAPVRNNGSTKKEVVAKKSVGKDESNVDKSLALSEMYNFGEASGLSSLNKDAAKRGMDLMPESKVDEYDERWRKIQIAEMELFVARGQLIKDQARIALAAFKKSVN